jgi:hypothetical protein
MAKVTGLSGNEIYCLALKQYSAGAPPLRQFNELVRRSAFGSHAE